MKKCLLCLFLATVLLPATTFAEEEEWTGVEMLEEAERQLEMTNIRLEQERAELGFTFERRMRELEIEKADLGIEKARLEIENAHRQLRGHDRHRPKGPMPIILLVALLNRILVPIWIYKDMRQRGASSVILVLLGILGGLFGLLVYGVVRMGDVNTNARTARK